MGSNLYSSTQPVHQVYLNAFWIDQTEVTNAMYALCVEVAACLPPLEFSSQTRSSYYDNPDFNSYPVINIDWEDAVVYCEWAERHLASEAEWEKAARGTDARMYPWGNEFDGTLANLCDANCSEEYAEKDIDDGFADTSPVGSYPKGASPYGVYDMVGNVVEWTSSILKPYPYDPNDGHESLEVEGQWVVIQSSPFIFPYDESIPVAFRPMSLREGKRVGIPFIGFRCASSP